MQTQQTPQVLQQPFAAQGDKNTIPNAATGTNKASLQEGFPPITGQPINQGGIPPERQDFNGAMNLNSQFYFAFQNGWWPTFTQEVSDAIGGYPQGAVLWLFDTKNNVYTPLLSLVGNNTYNFNTNKDYIGQYWAKILPDSGRGLPLGAIYFSSSSNADDNPGALPLWSGEYYTNASTLYPAFYAWVKSHTELCKTKTEYDAAISTYGECPYYVVDEVEGSLRLPKLVNYLKMANATDGITQAQAGLPNITGTFSEGGNAGDTATGAFYVANPIGTSNQGIASDGKLVGFDASRSSAIYGASTTVTPAHTTLYPWIIVNSKTVSPSQYVLLSQIGTANGVASLDADTKVPMAQIPSEVTDNLDLDFDPSAYNWPDIRPAARPNAVVLMAGVKADYSAYDNLGFIATCEGGYNVFIDGVQYGDTYASGAQCSVTWSQYSATAGFSVLQPEALTAHIVQIVPAVAGNNITAFKCHRVAASGQEAQGVLWVHFNLHTAINIQALLQDYAALYCPVCKAITAVNDLLQITTAADMCGQGADRYQYGAALDYCAELDFGGRTAVVSFNMASGNGGQMRVVRLKNLTDTQMACFCANASSLEKLETDGVLFKPTTVTRAFLNCPNLQYLPQIDFTNTQTAYDFVNGAASLRDTVLDIGYAHLLINFHFCNTPGLKGLLVSAQAPFDYASPPQINVSNTGLGQEALVALFKSLPAVTAGQVINVTGASGAASLTAQELAIATDKGWTVAR